MPVLALAEVVPADNSTHLVLNEGNSDSTFLTEFVGYYLTVDAGTVPGPWHVASQGRRSGAACSMKLGSHSAVTIHNFDLAMLGTPPRGRVICSASSRYSQPLYSMANGHPPSWVTTQSEPWGGTALPSGCRDCLSAMRPESWSIVHCKPCTIDSYCRQEIEAPKLPHSYTQTPQAPESKPQPTKTPNSV